MLDGHATSIDPMVAHIEIIERIRRLAEEQTGMLRDHRRAQVGVIAFRQVPQASLGHLHGHDHAGLIAPDVLHANEIRMFQLTDGLQRADFAGRGQA